MPTMSVWDDDETSEDWDEPDFDDADEDDPSATVTCAACGADVHEDAVMCPVCGEYVVEGTHLAWSARPLWWIALGLVGIAATILALAF